MPEIGSLIIQLESSAEVCSVAISKEGTTIDQIVLNEPYVHSRLLSIIIEDILYRNEYNYDDLVAVAVSGGPGSYTGLRVGFATAKGLCYALDIPLISISTLKILANTIKNELTHGVDLLMPLIDARRMEVYAAHFNNDLKCTKPDHAWVVDKNELQFLADRIDRIAFGGNGVKKLANLISEINGVNWYTYPVYCSAGDMSALAWQRLKSGTHDSVAYSEPFYLKPPNITTPKTLLG